MQNDAANIYCPNPNCESLNPETNNFCQQCRTPLPRRYLWAVHEGKLPCKPGEILADRYLFKGNRILLDTKPALPPAAPEEVPSAIAAYLRLFPYRLHVPQLYGQLPRAQTRFATDIWLLEQAPIAAIGGLGVGVVTNPKAPVEVELRPALVGIWKKASAMRQLNWLWQIAQLWQPFLTEGVASSLLNPDLLRVEGQLVRLLHLQLDQKAVSLSQLGQVWLQWVSSANPLIAPFLERLCQMLIQKQVRNGEHLVDLLDRGLAVCGRSQKRTYQIATGTDTGPSRRRNEDACYPVSGTFETPETEPIVIVCDGIGGHEGGNVASATAIEAIRQRVVMLQSHPSELDPKSLSQNLEQAACAANDRISDRNNDEQRQGRQRMGTTVVMALGNAHELYITHVGDSRAYWITSHGCYQVTLDDDVASREVRLGYALYREAVQQPAAGSLVQALGMNASGMLHPSVGRFVMDEDSIFLLCSDGLSDNDRVEQYWDTEILPILTGQLDLPEAASRLIAVGNTQNGHDNVTVGLVYCRVRDNKQSEISDVSLLDELDAISDTGGKSGDPTDSDAFEAIDADSSSTATVLIERSPKASPLPWLCTLAILLLMLGGGGALAYWFIPEIRAGLNPLIGINPSPSPDDPSLASPATPASNPPAVPSLDEQKLIQIQSLTPENAQTPTLTLQLHAAAAAIAPVKGIVTNGSILKVLSKTTTDTQTWLQLLVCSQGKVRAAAKPPVPNATGPSPPSPTPSSAPLLQPGESGWILETEVVSGFSIVDKPEQLDRCIDPSTAVPNPTRLGTPAPAASP